MQHFIQLENAHGWQTGILMAFLQVRPNGSTDPSKKISVVWYNPQRKNKQRKVTKFFNTRAGWADARRWLKIFDAKLVEQKFTQNFFPYRSTTEMFSVAFKKFLANRVLRKSGRESYTYASNKWVEFIGDKPLNKYVLSDGVVFITKMRGATKPLSENTIASYTKQLQIIFEWFIASNMAKQNPVKTIPRRRTQIKIIPDEHLKTIFAHFKKSNIAHYNFVRFTYLTGFRPSTSLALTGDCIKMDERVIIYQNIKENKESLFPIHNALFDLLNTMQIVPGASVFGWVDPKLKFFPRAMKTLEFNYSIKTLRKNLGTLAANNISLFAAQTMLDHENAATTEMSYSRRPLMDKLRVDIDEKIKFLN
jgi:integrase